MYAALERPEGRRRFWAESADEVERDVIEFRFTGGEIWRSRILERVPFRRFTVAYFQGSVASFELEPDGAGGTEVRLTEEHVPPGAWLDNHAGWVSVLLALKAAVDFGVDIRNCDPRRSWARGYVDV
ncbi:MAG: hypothetical protein QN178_13175 [Armatimonadota bacterium]|nr:hypothetical protein [Armatimonadota bacterium]